MNTVALGIIWLALALAGVVVRKTYYQVPLRELKRRAAKHDPVAENLYQAVAYGNSTKTLLWLYIGLTSAAAVIAFAQQLPWWLSLFIVAPLLWIVFSYLPASRVTALGTRLALIATPVIAWLLTYLHPALNRAADKVEQKYVASVHTGLFERDDLLQLIDQQSRQPDSRFTLEELEIARRALTFGDHTVADVVIPKKETKTLLADDTVGPILIDEVHKSGQKYILVRESKKGPLVGVVEAIDLGIRSNGKVKDVMRSTVYYLHEDDSLAQALHAFFVTNFPVFVVVNGFEEIVGIVPVEQALQQLLGHIPGEEFDQYADLQAVAARHKQSKSETSADKTDDAV
jgi:CBS domain containing-hemolysin-like protein